VACGDDGIASFDRIRYRRHDEGRRSRFSTFVMTVTSLSCRTL
jgi:hypothetical protein